MKIKKFSDVKDLSLDELKKNERELRKELFELNMKNSLSQLSSPIEVRKVRRNIAQIKTAISQKQA